MYSSRVMLQTFFFLVSKSSKSEPWVGLTIVTEPDLQQVHMSVVVTVNTVETGRDFTPGSDSAFLG